MMKQRQESIGIYDQNGRPELAAGERDEVAIIASFLPQQMDEAEMAAADRRRRRGDRRRRPEGHGQGHRRPAGAYAGPHGFRQGERRS